MTIQETGWRADAMSLSLSTRTFADTVATPATRPVKAPVSPVKARVRPPRPFSPAKVTKPRVVVDIEPLPWCPAKSPTMRRFGFTLAIGDLLPGMVVEEWPGDISRRIQCIENITADAVEITYADGSTAIANRNASFAEREL